jgi:uncharacterized membrane protein
MLLTSFEAANATTRIGGKVHPCSDVEAGHRLVKDLHTEPQADAYDAAVIEKRDNGKVRITKKHETPTRAGGVMGGGAGLATGLVVALLLARQSGWPARGYDCRWCRPGAVSGHAAAGMSRKDLKELGEYLDEARRSSLSGQ